MSKKNKGRNKHPPPKKQVQSVVLPVQEDETNPVIGRPHEYLNKVQPRLKEIEYWGLLGFTNLQTAKNLGIAESTFYEYQKEFSEFSEAVNKNKPLANAEVVKGLYQKCLNQVIEEKEEIIKEMFYKDKESGIEYPLLDFAGNPVIQHITKKSKRIVQADTNAIKFWLTNRDEENWKLKSEVKSDSTNKNLNVNANFDVTALSDKDLDEGIIELLNVISDT